MYKNSLNLRIGCSTLDELRVQSSPKVHIDSEWVRQHRGRHQVLPLGAREEAIGHGCEPNIGVKPDLMALMTGDHRPTTGLRHIADQKARPAIKPACIICKSL
jgi:hypothetical protein